MSERLDERAFKDWYYDCISGFEMTQVEIKLIAEIAQRAWEEAVSRSVKIITEGKPMNERRWKVIEGDENFAIGKIITLNKDDGTNIPWFEYPGIDKRHCIELTELVEIDADGNTIRTYAKGDTLDGGTLVQEEKMEGLDGVLVRAEKAIAGSLDFYSGSFVRGILRPLVDEIGSLRDKLKAVHDVWEGATEDTKWADVIFRNKYGERLLEKNDTRTLPKTIEQEIAEKYSCDSPHAHPMINGRRAIDVIRDALAEYKARTEVKQ